MAKSFCARNLNIAAVAVPEDSLRLRQLVWLRLRSLRSWLKSRAASGTRNHKGLRRRLPNQESILFVVPEAASWRFGRLAARLHSHGFNVNVAINSHEAGHIDKLFALEGTSQGLSRDWSVIPTDMVSPENTLDPAGHVFISKVLRDLPLTLPATHQVAGSRVCAIPYSLFPDFTPHSQYARAEHFGISAFGLPTSLHLRDARTVRPYSRNLFISGWPTLEDADAHWLRFRDEQLLWSGFRILWAPHWTIGHLPSHFGALHEFAPLFEDLLLSGWDITLRPHPILMRLFRQKELRQDVQRVFETFQDRGRISEGPFLADFFRASVLVTDSYGFLPEFSLFQKPVIFLSRRSSATPRWNTFGRAFFLAASHVTAPADLVSEICAAHVSKPEQSSRTAESLEQRFRTSLPHNVNCPVFSTTFLEHLSLA